MDKTKEIFKIGIACNLKQVHSSDEEAEFDEPETVEAIASALRAGGFEPFVLEATENFPQKLLDSRPDFVFNIAEGRGGRSRESQIPAICDYFGVPYTGSDAAALGLALDKSLTKRLAESFGVRTPASFVLGAKSPVFPGDLKFPILLKPNAEGSSKGVSDACVAKNAQELRELAEREFSRYGEDLLAEQYIDGREFTVGLLGNGGAVRVFEPMEIEYRKLRGEFKIYSYEVKRSYRDYIAYECPAKLEQGQRARLMQDAETVFNALGCCDFARVDFRLSPDGTVYFIEANPLPGLAPGYSDYPMLAGFNGVDYEELVLGVLRCAMERHQKESCG